MCFFISFIRQDGKKLYISADKSISEIRKSAIPVPSDQVSIMVQYLLETQYVASISID